MSMPGRQIPQNLGNTNFRARYSFSRILHYNINLSPTFSGKLPTSSNNVTSAMHPQFVYKSADCRRDLDGLP